MQGASLTVIARAWSPGLPPYNNYFLFASLHVGKWSMQEREAWKQDYHAEQRQGYVRTTDSNVELYSNIIDTAL